MRTISNGLASRRKFIESMGGSLAPAKLIYDSFNRTNGATGYTESSGPLGERTQVLPWVGGEISSNKLIITPEVGSNTVSNSGFDTDTGWLKSAAASIANGVATISNGSGSFDLYKYNQATAQRFNRYGLKINSISNGVVYINHSAASQIPIYRKNVAGTYYGSCFNSIINTFGVISTAGVNAEIDDLTIAPLTTATIFSTIDSKTIPGTYSVDLTFAQDSMGGLVLCLNSTTSPTAFILINVSFTGEYGIFVTKYPSLASSSVILSQTITSYVAGAPIKAVVWKTGGHVYMNVYYNGVQKGTTLDITDETLINNTIHGVFATSNQTSFDNFRIDLP